MKEERIRRFVNDEAMSEAVKSVLMTSFLKSRPEKDVHYLAAKSLAVEFLEDAWKVLQSYRNNVVEEEKTTHQVGL